MEQHNNQNQKQEGPERPRIPIKTYRWEDVRRARRKGGYPWTYLDKDPFNEQTDSDIFKMDMKKSKSASNIKKDGVEIQEITNGSDDFSKDNLETPDNVIIREASSEPEDHSKLSPRAVQYDEGLDLEEAESTDDISQYLDKEERGPQTIQTNEEAEEPKEASSQLPEATTSNELQDRAKSEEPPKRKRKSSVDSSYSRISLSRLNFLKKLKNAKDKVKVPKLTLPPLPRKQSKKGKGKEKTKEKEEKENKPESKKSEIKVKPSLNVKPVYIHIPLKPPEGQTDEFSYLEFGEKKPPDEPKEKEEKEKNEEEKNEEKYEEKIEKKNEEDITKEQPKEMETVEKQLPQPMEVDGENINDIVAIEILKRQSIDLADSTNGYNFEGNKEGDIFIIQQHPEDAPSDDVAIIILGSNDQSSSKSEDTKSLKREKSRKRAKSAEPDRNRRSSIDSSYSRKSLSKMAWIQKKWKNTKLFPTLSLSSLRSGGKKKEIKKDKENVPENKPQETKKIEKPKNTKPQYIHIPLRPPPGQTDEFSYLEFEEKPPQTENSIKESQPQPQLQPQPQDSLETPDPSDVQFIVLTPPSDDEILDDHIMMPDTPSSASSSTFFENKVDELKEIAQGAIRKLQPVREEAKAEDVEKQPEIVNADKTNLEAEGKEEQKPEEKPDKKKKKTKTDKITSEAETNKDELDVKHKTESVGKVNKESEPKVEKIIVDEEDGLKSTEPEKKSAEELKLKKKVSFKRRSRDESHKDDDYEDIQAPANEEPKQESNKEKLSAMDTSQSMSIDEEKTYLDEKVIKSTSLEEDYNKWSKLSDHEYEPINPPADNVSPTVHFAEPETQQEKPISKASSTTSMERRMLGGELEEFTAEEIQNQIEDRFFKQQQSIDIIIEGPTTTITKTTTTEEQPKKPEGPGKLQQAQQAIKAQAGKFKDKIHGIKKPHITLPKRSNLPKFKMERPKLFPKIPDKAKINLPFNLPGKGTAKRPPKKQYSTESNYGETKVNYFDFSTYPRIFKKKPKKDLDSFGTKSDPDSDLATGSLKIKKDSSWQSKESDRWGGSDSVRIPLRPEDSFDDTNDDRREDSVERRMASHIQYDDDIDIDDAYQKENQQINSASPFSSNYNSRWDRGRFHAEGQIDPEYLENIKNREYKVTDLDSPEDEVQPNNSFDTNTSKDIHSSESSLGMHRRGVVEEIDSDEFFIRPKGISQDNIEFGMYLSNEIREAFHSPISALSDNVQIDMAASNQSLPDTHSKKKAVKKPKRKKTPHVSQEFVGQDADSEQEQVSLPPARPKRKSKKNKKPKDDDIIPYQTTIHVHEDDDGGEEIEDVVQVKKDNLGILGYEPDGGTYENEQMEGKEQPEITVTDPYKGIKYESEEREEPEIRPEPPRRRHRSLKSLTNSEPDFIMDDYRFDREEARNIKCEHEYIIPTPEEAQSPQPPPVKPPRSLSRSRSSLQSYDTNGEQAPKRPARNRSRTSSLSRTTSQMDDLTGRDVESFTYENEEPCIEEPCVRKDCDYMGYAIVDKYKKREPPLPPRKRSVQSTASDTKFFTVPRQGTESQAPPPVRPLRNYSTLGPQSLGPSRPPRRKRFVDMTDEEKENVDIMQYIEIEDEPNRDLQSGEVLQKMKDRPLPAPPRPPRKTKALHDISSHENLTDIDKEEDNKIIEETVSTQTEPLPDDFECEEIIQESTDRIITPSPRPTEIVTIERIFMPPSHYTNHEETITHAALVVEPLNGAKILPDSQLTKPVIHNIPVTKDYDYETSEIPEDFKKLKDPETPTTGAKIIERIIERPVVVQPDSKTEIELLKAQKLQVSDLDVERLSVNELLANKIVVSEIDSGNILTSEISSRAGAVKVGEIELPPAFVQQLFERLQSSSSTQAAQESAEEESAKSEQKKNSN